MKPLRTLLAALAVALPVVASAQWQWIDKDGRKVFSDRPPSADVPAKNILKQPGARTPSVVPGDVLGAGPATGDGPKGAPVGAQAGAPKLNPALPKPTGKDRDLEEKLKQAQAAEEQKKQAEAARIAKTRAENCERSKRAKATFDSGVRIASTNAKGEREIMDDASRAVELKRLEGVIASECKS